MFTGVKIRELRLEKGLLQKELAEKIHIASNTLSQFESGKANPSYDVLIALADFFEVSTDYLLGREDDFGNVTVYKADTLSEEEQKIIDALRKSAPIYPVEWVTMYAELPAYMQERIFAELKGMNLGYKVSKKKVN